VSWLHAQLSAISRNLYDSTVVHARDSIGVVKDSRIVSHDNKRSVAIKRFVAKQLHYLGTSRMVERARRLIAHDELWVVHKGAGNRDPLLLTAG